MDAPGLVLASNNDPLVPERASEELGELAKRGGIQWHDTANHIAPINDAAWCAAAIRKFLTP
jgi:hypothetical protein